MWVIPNTTVTISEPTPTPANNEWGDETTTWAATATGVSASITEQSRNTFDPASGAPRQVRFVTGRVPTGTAVTTKSRVTDEVNGRVYSVASVRQHSNPLYTSEVILELVRTDQGNP